MSAHARLVSVSLLVASSLSAQAITVDDDDPGADFATIGAATVAAAEGDVIVVRDGTYTEFVTVTGKSLSIVADVGASVLWGGQLRLMGLAPSQPFVLTGVTIEALAAPFDALAPLVVDGCQGVVWVEDCSFSSFSQSVVSANCIEVEDSSRVVLTRVSALGGNVFGVSVPGGPGLRVASSSVYAFDSVLEGGPGGQDPSTPSDGGPGALLLEQGFLYASGSTLLGGVGGIGGSIFGCADSGGGGTGLQMVDVSAQAALIDTATVGGPPGGFEGAGVCDPGPNGTPRDIQAGTVNDLTPNLPHDLDATSPVVSGQPITITVSATPGEFAIVGYSPGPFAFYVPGLLGPTLLQQPTSSVPVGFVPAGGTSILTATITLPPGVLVSELWLQAAFLSFAPSQIFLSTPAHIAVLAPGL